MKHVLIAFLIWVMALPVQAGRFPFALLAGSSSGGGGGGGTLLDSYTDTEGTNLESHTGEEITWTLRGGSARLDIESNAMGSTNNGGISDYYSSYSPADADYSHEAQFKCGASNNVTPGITVRHATGSQTFIMGYYQSGWKIRECNSGSCSQLGSTSTNNNCTTQRTVKLQAIGTTVKLFVDGGEEVSATTAVTATGTIGAAAYYSDSGSGRWVDDSTYIDE